MLKKIKDRIQKENHENAQTTLKRYEKAQKAVTDWRGYIESVK